ncbi:Organic cation transporter-like protein [Exaiptasia diaphana]|nr:Organic cation transporter-like protein [Exaiptasia diaphana]
MDPLSTDEVLDKIGSFGRYQFLLLILMGFMQIFGDGFQGMIASFLAAEPPWRCVSNSSSCNITGSFSPGQDGYKLRCRLHRDQWEFDTSEFTSIVSEWDLVCDRSSLSSMAKSIVFAGYMVGVIFGGILSDKIGRKPIVFFPSVLASILALTASFANVFWLFAVLRGLVGVCLGSASLAMFVLMVEYVGVKHRAMAGTSLWYFFTISLMMLVLFAYLLREWRMLSIAAAAPGLLQVLFWWFLPESSRWLITRGKQDESKAYFTKIARFNGKEMPPNPIAVVEEKQRVGDIRDLFCSLKHARITLSIWFSWLVVSMVYWGTLFSFDTFGGNRYLAFFLVAIVEVPSIFFTIKSMDRFGRKKSLLVSLILASIASTAAVLLQRDPSQTGFRVGRIVMSMTAKFFITFAFDTLYVFSAELFPTVARKVGLGTSSAAGRIGSISAPFIVQLLQSAIVLSAIMEPITTGEDW